MVELEIVGEIKYTSKQKQVNETLNEYEERKTLSVPGGQRTVSTAAWESDKCPPPVESSHYY